LVLELGRLTHFLGAERMTGPSFARGRREVDSVVLFELGMGARDHDSGSGNGSGSGSTFTGVSSDFDDSVLQRVAECGDQESADPSAPTVGSVLDGKYRLEGLVGRGGMGFVFAARHLTTGRPVAIKWMLRRGDLDQQKKRFVREARAAGRIRHRNVIDIYDVVSDENSTYLVIELLEGESLRSRLSRGRLDPNEAVELAVSLLEGLSEAHRQGVIHRDLKPENVFLCTSPPCIKILDFGISVLSEALPTTDANLTKTGYFVGTPIYTPLERLREKQPFDHRVDLYSVGVILYEMLTYTLPFSGRTPSELAYQLAVSVPRPPRASRPDLAPALEDVMLKALAREPDHRFADAREFIVALRGALQAPRRMRIAVGLGVEATLAALRRSSARVAVAVLIALVAGITLAARTTPPARALRQAGALPVGSLSKSTAVLIPPVGGSRPRVLSVATPVPQPAKAGRSRAPSVKMARPSGTVSAPVTSASAETGAQRTSGTAEVTVIVFPYGDVWIDGRRIGASPATSKVLAGTHRIAGGRTAPERETTVNLAPDESRQVLLSWKESGAKGSAQP
jgi:eukaryotic-like serine/threonine-protein kinase